MSLNTAEDVCKFIINRNSHSKRIIIHWFGGEPLLNTEAIDYITNRLTKEYSDSNVQLIFNMTTNGILFDQYMIQKAKLDWRLNKIQITLDGTKAVYENTKKYVNIPDSFNKVISNINNLLANKIPVVIRLNYGFHNINDIFNLIDYLSLSIHNKDYLNCYAFPLFDIGEYCPSDRELSHYMIDIIDSLIKCGLRKPTNIGIEMRKMQCHACNINSFVIYPNGSLGKCSITSTSSSEKLGTIYSDIPLSVNYLKWCNTELSEECKSCVFLPLCQGGCRASNLSLSNARHYLYKNCFTDYLKMMINHLSN